MPEPPDGGPQARARDESPRLSHVIDATPIAVRADAPGELPLPPAHLELTWRPLTRDDAGQLLALRQAIESVETSAERVSPVTVQEWLTTPWRDLDKDTLGGFDRSGTLRAYGSSELPPEERVLRAVLNGGVHPAWRGRGLGVALLAWQEGRARQQLAASGKDLPARIAAFVDERAKGQRQLYASAGFSPKRWYTTMRRDLRLPLPEAPELDRVTIEPWRSELDEEVRLAHNEAFADLWGSPAQTRERWVHRAQFAPEWSFVAVDRSGDAPQVIGYLLSSRREQNWAAAGYSYGYSDLLGVCRPWRGRGVAVALLATAMAAYAADGMRYAVLDVDATNPTGAHELYSGLAYEATRTEVMYTVEI